MAIVFPKALVIRGVQVQVESLEEMDDLIARYGGSGVASPQSGGIGRASEFGNEPHSADDSLLRALVASHNRGLLVHEIRDRLRVRGKVGGPLKAWSIRVGLPSRRGGEPITAKRRSDGRSYCLTEEAFQVARRLLAKQ